MPKLKYHLIKSSWISLLLLIAACTAVGSPEEPTNTISPTDASNQARPVGQSSGATSTSPDPFPASKYDDLEIITLLPRDGIPAIDNPEFLSVAEADDVYEADELVIGVTFNEEARAYSVPLLSNHEIVNDTVGGVKIAVTW